jgi:hypothetical protein
MAERVLQRATGMVVVVALPCVESGASHEARARRVRVGGSPAAVQQREKRYCDPEIRLPDLHDASLAT